MTLFDYIAVGLMLLSGLIGYLRGATREVTSVIAFLLAAAIALFGQRYFGPIAREVIHTEWLATGAAILFLFVIFYILLRLVGGVVTRKVRQTSLSGLDRVLGSMLGLLRFVVAIGAFTLLLGAAIPPDRMPTWLTHAMVYPLAQSAGQTLRLMAPHGMQMAQDAVPVMSGEIKKDFLSTNTAADTPDQPRQSSNDPTETSR